jgi:hypothetical protein
MYVRLIRKSNTAIRHERDQSLSVPIPVRKKNLFQSRSRRKTVLVPVLVKKRNWVPVPPGPRLLCPSLTAIQAVPTHTCACTQSYPHPYLHLPSHSHPSSYYNLYRHYSGESFLMASNPRDFVLIKSGYTEFICLYWINMKTTKTFI